MRPWDCLCQANTAQNVSWQSAQARPVPDLQASFSQMYTCIVITSNRARANLVFQDKKSKTQMSSSCSLPCSITCNMPYHAKSDLSVAAWRGEAAKVLSPSRVSAA